MVEPAAGELALRGSPGGLAGLGHQRPGWRHAGQQPRHPPVPRWVKDRPGADAVRDLATLLGRCYSSTRRSTLGTLPSRARPLLSQSLVFPGKK